MEVIDTLHGGLDIGHRGGRGDTVVDIGDVDAVSTAGVGRIDTGTPSVGHEGRVVGGAGGTELQGVDVFAHLGIGVIGVGHGRVAQLGDRHG